MATVDGTLTRQSTSPTLEYTNKRMRMRGGETLQATQQSTEVDDIVIFCCAALFVLVLSVMY